MHRCAYGDCGWHAVAPSERSARRQYERHLLSAHVEVVDEDVPEGTVKVRRDGDDEWTTIAVDEALRDARR